MNGPAATMASQLLSARNVRALFDSVKAFLFDCDGVIWKGDKLVDGVPQTLEFLRAKVCRFLIISH
uniref:Phosphoglycolate phosphatase n=1 Tax=Rhizophora mucronata TaxID=61149 RepID=A0A2P2M9N1_RHIMU